MCEYQLSAWIYCIYKIRISLVKVLLAYIIIQVIHHSWYPNNNLHSNLQCNSIDVLCMNDTLLKACHLTIVWNGHSELSMTLKFSGHMQYSWRGQTFSAFMQITPTMKPNRFGMEGWIFFYFYVTLICPIMLNQKRQCITVTSKWAR